MVGIPLGLSSKKSGKSGGFVLTIVLVFVYYFVSLIGVSLAKQGRVSPVFGAWLANLVFFAAALFLLWQAERRPFALSAIRLAWKRNELPANGLGTKPQARTPRNCLRQCLPARLHAAASLQRQLSPRCSMTTCCAISSSTLG